MKALVTPTLIALALVASLAVAKTAFGDGCQQLYGGYGGGTCPRGEVMIDKMVKHLTTGVFVDNLGLNDPKLAAGQEVTFKLTVKNTSNVLLSSVEVEDFLPAELEYVSGPGLKFVVKDLEANASRDYEIKAKAKSVSGTMCVVNTAEARIPENTDRDTAQVCIEKPVVPSLPKTGPAEVVLVMSGVSAVAGVMLTKRAKKLIGE